MGDIHYDLAGIESGLATINAIHAAKQDIGNQMVAQYSQLDSVAAGQATSASMDFSNLASHARAQEVEVIQMIHQGVTQASADLQSVDQGFMGIMGT
jgi:hypothetical protein